MLFRYHVTNDAAFSSSLLETHARSSLLNPTVLGCTFWCKCGFTKIKESTNDLQVQLACLTVRPNATFMETICQMGTIRITNTSAKRGILYALVGVICLQCVFSHQPLHVANYQASNDLCTGQFVLRYESGNVDVVA